MLKANSLSILCCNITCYFCEEFVFWEGDSVLFAMPCKCLQSGITAVLPSFLAASTLCLFVGLAWLPECLCRPGEPRAPGRCLEWWTHVVEPHSGSGARGASAAWSPAQAEAALRGRVTLPLGYTLGYKAGAVQALPGAQHSLVYCCVNPCCPPMCTSVLKFGIFCIIDLFVTERQIGWWGAWFLISVLRYLEPLPFFYFGFVPCNTGEIQLTVFSHWSGMQWSLSFIVCFSNVSRVEMF